MLPCSTGLRPGCPIVDVIVEVGVIVDELVIVNVDLDLDLDDPGLLSRSSQGCSVFC